jgi:hypothetical protein
MSRLWVQGGAEGIGSFLNTAPPPCYLIYLLAAGFGLPCSEDALVGPHESQFPSQVIDLYCFYSPTIPTSPIWVLPPLQTCTQRTTVWSKQAAKRHSPSTQTSFKGSQPSEALQVSWNYSCSDLTSWKGRRWLGWGPTLLTGSTAAGGPSCQWWPSCTWEWSCRTSSPLALESSYAWASLKA